MIELTVKATDEKLYETQQFISAFLEENGASMKTVMQMEIVVEEIFVNIAHYAYGEETGEAKICCSMSADEPDSAVISFYDRGVPFDPVKKEDVDITLSVEERGIGGLGIHMVKKMVDKVAYEYADGQNILTIVKKIK